MIGKLFGHAETATTTKYAHLLQPGEGCRRRRIFPSRRLAKWGDGNRKGYPDHQVEAAPRIV